MSLLLFAHDHIDAMLIVQNWCSHAVMGLSCQVVEHQAASYGCSAKTDWHLDTNPYYPALVNDKAAHEFASSVAVR